MSFIHFFTLGFRPNYLIVGIILGVILGIYSFFRLDFLFSYYNMDRNNSLIIRIILSIFIFLCSFNVQSTATIVIAYLIGCFILVDIIFLIFRLLFKKRFKIHRSGILAIILFILMMGYGIYGINNVDSTEYNITTDKTNESYTILYISDLHYDTIQNPQLLKNKLSEMNNTKPDIIILGGDITDEGTSKESMVEVFKELGSLNSTFGTFFVYGNHDKQPNIYDYRNGTKPYTDKELVSAIENNGIKVLQDSKVIINEDIVLIGRDDAGHGNTNNQANVSDLLKISDLDKFLILLDHQPLNEINNSKLGCDLQISGHTHGGQIFPYGLVREIIKEPNYGKYYFGNMTEIVSSGFCGWGISFRNENPCEYVVININ